MSTNTESIKTAVEAGVTELARKIGDTVGDDKVSVVVPVVVVQVGCQVMEKRED